MHWKLPASCWEVWTVPLTEFQQEFLRNCSHRWNVKTGATRSGKTYLDCAVTIPKRICAARDEGLCVMLGNTLGTLERNVLEPMRALWVLLIQTAYNQSMLLFCCALHSYSPSKQLM